MFGLDSFNSTFNFDLVSYIRNECLSLFLDRVLFRAFLVTNMLLLLPLLIFVLFIGAQQWMRSRRRCTSSDAANASQSDVFTYHMVAMEMCIVLIVVRYLFSYFTNDWTFDFLKLIYSSWCAKVQFLLLTCVEFYLAVVHPVIYLRLKSSGGVWIRGISAAVVWLLCVLGGVVSYRCTDLVTVVLCLCLLVLDLAVVSFCCISVLWTLKRPGPGENAEDKVDPSKQKAFQTILKIMLVIWLCLLGMLVFFGMEVLVTLIDLRMCFSTAFTYWLTLPSTLLLPLLFFQRAGKLSCCKK